MPGKIAKVLVRAEQAVDERDLLLILEAMKMERAHRKRRSAVHRPQGRRRSPDCARQAPAPSSWRSANVPDPRPPRAAAAARADLRSRAARRSAKRKRHRFERREDPLHRPLLGAAASTTIETTSFVSPKAVPQMADAADVMAGIERRPGVRYLALVPNLRGLERARAAGVDSIAVFTAASESFAKRNINMSIDESLQVFGEVVAQAGKLPMDVEVRGYLSTAFGCPYEGRRSPRSRTLRALPTGYGSWELTNCRLATRSAWARPTKLGASSTR